MSTDASKALTSVTSLTSWIAGTTNRVTVADDGDGTVTLSAPQDTHTAAEPTFAGLNLIKATSVSGLFNWTDTTGYGEFAFKEGSVYKGFVGAYGSVYAVAGLRDAFIFTAATDNLGSIFFRTKTGGTYADRMSISNAGVINVPGLTASRLLATDGSKNLASVSNLASWVAGTTNEIDVTDDGDGTITIGLVDPLIVSKGGTGTSTGSITGTGALTFAAGGTDQNVTLTPSGIGYTILGGGVGVGTTTPLAKLHIRSAAGGTGIVPVLILDPFSTTDGDGSEIRFLTSNSSTTGLAIQGVREAAGAYGSLRFKTRGVDGEIERLRITHDAKVGIGTTLPNEKLEVAGKIRALTAFNLNGTDGVSDSGAGVPTALTISGGIVTAVTKNDWLDQSVKQAASPAFTGLIVNTTTLVVDAVAGAVGIGTATPTGRSLVIQGDASGKGTIDLRRYWNTTAPPTLYTRKSRGTIAAPLTVLNGDRCGGIECSAWDGSAFTYGGYFGTVVDGSVATGSVPMGFQFIVGYPIVEKMRLAPSGYLGIGTPVPPVMLSVAGDGLFVTDAGIGAEVLTNGALTSGTSWTAAGDCTLSSNCSVWAFSAGTGTLTQASGSFAVAATANSWYKLTLALSSVVGNPVITITTSFSAETVTVQSLAGTRTIYLRTGAAPGDFVISAILASGDAFVLDTISLKPISSSAVIDDGCVGVGVGTPAEDVHVADTVRADTAFNLNGTDGVTQAGASGKVSDVTAIAGGIATAQTQITYVADGTYTFYNDGTPGNVTSITTTNGRITTVVVEPEP